jgi:hypothetical protein
MHVLFFRKLSTIMYVEPDLEKLGAKDLKEQIEHMMRVERYDQKQG